MHTGIIGLERVFSDLSRKYPFAEGAATTALDGWELPDDIFSDAVVHPMVPRGGVDLLYLIRIDFKSGEVLLSIGSQKDAVRPDMSRCLVGSFSDGVVRLVDSSGRESGLLACGPGWSREARFCEVHAFNGVLLSAASCCPIEMAWVSGFVDSGGTLTRGRTVELEGDDCIRPRLSNTGKMPELSFDIQTKPAVMSNPLRQLVVIVEGTTVFDATRLSQNSVILSTPKLSRSDVKWHAHREAYVAKPRSSSSLCDSHGPGETDRECYATVTSEKRGHISILPSKCGYADIITPDVTGLDNAVWIGPIAGKASPTSPKYSPAMSQSEIGESVKRLMSRPESHGSGIIVSIPGISNAK